MVNRWLEGAVLGVEKKRTDQGKYVVGLFRVLLGEISALGW